VVVEQKDEAKRYVEKWLEEKHMNTHTWWTDGSRSDDGKVGALAVYSDNGEGWISVRNGPIRL